jgi:glycosyltransferase involved in cell wall biosynthesis
MTDSTDSELPLITIGMCTFNAQETINRALKSALDQTWPNIEIVIVDDCSSDRTWSILKNMMDVHSEIKIYQNNANGGVAISRNRIITEAKGEFIAFFDDDDESYSDRLSLQYERVVSYENDFNLDGAPVICHSSRKVVYPDGRILNQPTMGTILNRYVPHGVSVVRRILLGDKLEDGRGACPTCCQFARNSTYQMLKGFDPDFRRSEDTEFVIRLAFSGGHFVGLSDPLVVQYMGRNSPKSLEQEYYYHKMVLKKFSDFLKSEGQYAFCRKWLDLKYCWLLKSYRSFFVKGVIIFYKHPGYTLKRLIQAIPNIGINNQFRQFHSRDL